MKNPLSTLFFIAITLTLVFFALWVLRAPEVLSPTVQNEVVKTNRQEGIPVTFSGYMNKESVISAISLDPPVSTTQEWSGKTLHLFPPEEAYENGVITISIATSARTILGRHLKQEYHQSFIMSESPKVLLVSPQGGNVKPNERITIVFSEPMAGDDDLEKPAHPPITISPEIAGGWQWVSARALVFSPKGESLPLSTDIRVIILKNIKSRDGAGLKNPKEWSFTTERMVITSIEEKKKVSPGRPMVFTFSQPVSLASLSGKMTVLMDGKSIPVKLEWEKVGNEESKTRVTVHPTGGWHYNAFYTIRIQSGVMATEGNAGTEDSFESTIETEPLVVWTTNSEKSTSMGSNGYISLVTNLEINEDELKKRITITPSTAFSLHERSNDEEIKETLTESMNAEKYFTLVFNEPLQGGATREVSVGGKMKLTSGKTFTQDPLIRTFRVADALVLLGTSPVTDASYKELCLYTNNEIDLHHSLVTITPTPKKESRIDAFTDETQEMTSCEHKQGMVTTVVSFFLPSLQKSIVNLTQIRDIFGQELSGEKTLTLETESMKGEDKFITSDHKNFYLNTNDLKSSPVRVHSQNIDELIVNVCKLDPETIIGIETRQPKKWDSFVPNKKDCLDLITTTIPVRAEEWITTTSEIRIKDIMPDATWGQYLIKVWTPSLDPSGMTGKVVQLVQYSNFHLMSKKGDNTLVWLTDLTTGQGVEKASLVFYSGEGNILKQGRTAARGIYTTSANNLSYEYVVATLGSDTILSKAYWQEGIASWDFGLAGDWKKKEHFIGAIRSDKNMYKNGEIISYFGVVRKDVDAELTVSQKNAAYVTLIDQFGEELYKRFHSVDEFGTIQGNIRTGQELNQGTYHLKMCIGALREFCDGDEYSELIEVHSGDERPFTLLLHADKEVYTSGETLVLSGEASSPFGASLIGRKGTWMVYEEIGEGEHQSSWEEKDRGSFHLDGNGEFNVSYPLSFDDPLDKNSRLKQRKVHRLMVQVKVSDDISNSNTESLMRNVFPSEFSVKINTEGSLFKELENISMSITTKSFLEEEVPNQYVLVRIEKQENADSPNTVNRVVAEQVVKTNEMGETRVVINHLEEGQYLLHALAEDALGNIAQSSKVIYIGTSSPIVGSEEKKTIDITPDKEAYTVGEQAVLTLQTPYADVPMLITIERGGVMETKRVIANGNTAETTILLTEAMAPNIFVSAVAVQSEEKYSVALGYAELKVNSATKILQVNISTEKEKYELGEEVAVSFSVSHLESPLQSLLQIRIRQADKFATKDLDISKDLYSPRGIRVSTSDSIVQWYSSGVSSKEELSLDELVTEDIPETVGQGTIVDWRQIQTDEKGVASTTFVLPEEAGEWIIEAVAISKDDRFGYRSKTVSNEEELTIQTLAPHFLRYDDRGNIKVLLKNTSPQNDNFQLHLKTTNINLFSPEQQLVGIQVGEEKEILFDVQAVDSNGSNFAELAVEARGKVESDEDSIIIPLLPASENFHVNRSGMVTERESLTINEVTSSKTRQKNETIQVRISRSPGAILSSLIHDSLVNQEGTSLGIASHLKAIGTAMKVEEHIGHQIPNLFPNIKTEQEEEILPERLARGYVEQLKEMQNEDGGWNLFQSSVSSAKITAFVLENAGEGKKQLGGIGNVSVRKAIAYLEKWLGGKTEMQSPLAFHGTADSQTPPQLELPAVQAVELESGDYYRPELNEMAYPMFVLETWGSDNRKMREELYERRTELNPVNLIYLYKTFLLSERGQEKTESIKNEILRMMVKNQRIITHQNESSRYMAALLFPLISEKEAQLREMFFKIILEDTGDVTESLFEKTQLMGALAESIIADQPEGQFGLMQLLANHRTVKNWSFTEEEPFAIETWIAPLQKIIGDSEDSISIEFIPGSTGPFYFSVDMNYQTDVETIRPLDKGIVIRREYSKLFSGKKDEAIRVGDKMTAKLTIIVPEDVEYLKIESPLPGGFETITTTEKKNGKTGLPMVCPESSLSCDEPAISSQSFLFNRIEEKESGLVLYAYSLPRGIYSYTYLVQATMEGEFASTPATAKSLWDSTVEARTSGGSIRIER